METPTKIKIAAAIAIPVGIGLIFAGWQAKEHLALLEKDGVVTPGEIVGGEWKTGKRSIHKFEVAYLPKGMVKPVTKTFDVTVDYFNAHASETKVTNEKAEVRYLPTNPTDAILVGGSTDDATMFPIGIVVMIGGIATLGFMLKRKA